MSLQEGLGESKLSALGGHSEQTSACRPGREPLHTQALPSSWLPACLAVREKCVPSRPPDRGALQQELTKPGGSRFHGAGELRSAWDGAEGQHKHLGAFGEPWAGGVCKQVT